MICIVCARRIARDCSKPRPAHQGIREFGRQWTVVSVSESKTQLTFNGMNSSDIVITGRVKISREELLKVGGGKKYTAAPIEVFKLYTSMTAPDEGRVGE